MDKVFLRPQYTIHHRQSRSLRLNIQPTTGYLIAVLLQGRIRCDVGKHTGELNQQGAALLLSPGKGTTLKIVDSEFITINLSPSLVLDCASRMGMIRAGASIEFREPVVEPDQKLARIASTLSDELRDEEAGQEVVVAALVEQTTAHLLRRYSNARRADQLELSRVGLIDRRIRRAVELMQARMGEELPLDQIAYAAYLSPFHFARLFKKVTGATPHAYLAELRVARARTLLAETDLSITEVGARVGYGSSSHFTKAFRQATGLTPSAFRNALVSR